MSWFETGFYPNFRPTRGLFQGLVRQCGSYGSDYNTSKSISDIGLKQVLIQIFALQEGFFKAWFASAVPMAATITRQNL